MWMHIGQSVLWSVIQVVWSWIWIQAAAFGLYTYTLPVFLKSVVIYTKLRHLLSVLTNVLGHYVVPSYHLNRHLVLRKLLYFTHSVFFTLSNSMYLQHAICSSSPVGTTVLNIKQPIIDFELLIYRWSWLVSQHICILSAYLLVHTCF